MHGPGHSQWGNASSSNLAAIVGEVGQLDGVQPNMWRRHSIAISGVPQCWTDEPKLYGEQRRRAALQYAVLSRCVCACVRACMCVHVQCVCARACGACVRAYILLHCVRNACFTHLNMYVNTLCASSVPKVVLGFNDILSQMHARVRNFILLYFWFSVNGGFTSWSNWSLCTATCGNGTQHRNRSCSNPAPSCGGIDCRGPFIDVTSCAVVPCPGIGVTL